MEQKQIKLQNITPPNHILHANNGLLHRPVITLLEVVTVKSNKNTIY